MLGFCSCTNLHANAETCSNILLGQRFRQGVFYMVRRCLHSNVNVGQHFKHWNHPMVCFTGWVLTSKIYQHFCLVSIKIGRQAFFLNCFVPFTLSKPAQRPENISQCNCKSNRISMVQSGPIGLLKI